MRLGVPQLEGLRTGSPDLVRAMSLEQYFDYLAVRLNGSKAQDKHIVLNWRFTDAGEQLVLRLRDGTLATDLGTQSPDADATVVLTRETLDRISLQQLSFPAALEQGLIRIQDGTPAPLVELLGLFDTFASAFPLVEPRVD